MCGNKKDPSAKTSISSKRRNRESIESKIDVKIALGKCNSRVSFNQKVKGQSHKVVSEVAVRSSNLVVICGA